MNRQSAEEGPRRRLQLEVLEGRVVPSTTVIQDALEGSGSSGGAHPVNCGCQSTTPVHTLTENTRARVLVTHTHSPNRAVRANEHFPVARNDLAFTRVHSPVV